MNGARAAVRVASVAALGGLIFGYGLSLINSAVGALQYEFAVGNVMLGFAAAASLLGAAAGAVVFTIPLEDMPEQA